MKIAVIHRLDDTYIEKAWPLGNNRVSKTIDTVCSRRSAPTAFQRSVPNEPAVRFWIEPQCGPDRS
jgi:hypothetical protein